MSIPNAKRFGFQAIVVHFGTFDFELLCLIGPSKNLVKMVRQQMCDPEFTCPIQNRRGLHFQRDGYSPIIWFPRKPRTPPEHGALAHETLHAVRSLLVDWAGMVLNADTDEAFCHATGYAVRTILERAR